MKRAGVLFFSSHCAVLYFTLKLMSLSVTHTSPDKCLASDQAVH